MRHLAKKVGGGENQRSSLPENSSQLQRYRDARYREEEIQCAVTRELKNISKTAFHGDHEEDERTCKQMYLLRRNVF
jgi:hypothetical protein